MGKANKVKAELIDAVEMVNLIQTLKDVADNKSYTLLNQKYKFRRFGESFVEFFRMMSLTKVEHPLLKNNNPTVGIFVVTIDGSFLGQFNNKIIRLGLDQREKHPQFKFIGCGTKSIDRLKPLTPEIKIFDAVMRYIDGKLEVEPPDQESYEILLESKVEPLAGYFKKMDKGSRVRRFLENCYLDEGWAVAEFISDTFFLKKNPRPSE